MGNTNYLELSWSTSRGRDTYGYNICRLDDTGSIGTPRFRTLGGGYDMIGTVFGQWLQWKYQDRLLALADRAAAVSDDSGYHSKGDDHASWHDKGNGLLYGMTYHTKTGKDRYVSLDGACGIDSMRLIADQIGLSVQSAVNRRGNVNGYIVTDKALADIQ